METNQPPQTCPNCQSPMKEKEGISSKTGKPYHFWGCSDYPNCSYIWRPEKKGTKQTPMREYDQGEKIITKLDNLSSAVKIMNDNLVNIAEGINKLLKK